MTEDGNANNVNYIRMSSNFPYYHRNIIGLSKRYAITYWDSAGKEQTTTIPLFEPVRDRLPAQAGAGNEKKINGKQTKAIARPAVAGH